MADSKAVIKSVDMSEEMQQEAIEVSTQALEKYNIEKDIAAHIKREFDKKYGPTWHCVVGRNFGSFVTHGCLSFTYFFTSKCNGLILMWNLILASIQAIIQVMTVVILGFIFAKAGHFNMDKQKWLSKLNLMYFTPCLLFSNVASTISFEKFIGLWPIPVFYYVYSLLFYAITQLSTRALGLKADHRRFVLACVMFQNTNSLPLAIISSLSVSEAANILFWGSDDTQEAVAARGTSYTLFFAIFGNLLRWSYGYQLLQKHQTDDIVEEYPQQQDQPHDSSSTTTPSERSTSSTASGQSVKQQQPASETSPLLPKHLHNNNTPVVIIRHDQQQDPSHVTPTSFAHSSLRKLGVAIKQLALRFNSFMTPPLYAAVLALIVGLTPLKQILYDKQSFLYPSFTKAIEMCGKAAVPIVLSCLGAQLASISASQHHTPGIQKPVTAAVVIRMLMAPLVVVPLVVLFVKVGSAYSILATDPVFSVMLIVLGCTPTAINLIQISQVNAIFEEEMLHVLFWSYGVVCVPVVTLIVFLALNVVDRLL